MKLVIPVDFSKVAQNAVDYAVKLILELGGELHFVNTYQMPSGATNLMKDFVGKMKEISVDGINKLEEELTSSYPSLQGKLYFYSVHGSLSSQIRQINRLHNIDFVLMGTKGAHDALESMMGTNGVEIAANTSKPTLLIPESASYNGIKKLAITTDLEIPEDVNLTNTLKNLKVSEKNELKAVSITQLSKVDSVKIDAFKSKLAPYTVDVEIIEDENVESALLNYIDNTELDLVVAVAKKYSFFENIFHTSISKKLAMKSSNPLLIIKE